MTFVAYQRPIKPRQPYRIIHVVTRQFSAISLWCYMASKIMHPFFNIFNRVKDVIIAIIWTTIWSIINPHYNLLLFLLIQYYFVFLSTRWSSNKV